MSEEKLKELKKLLREAESAPSCDRQKTLAALGKFILDEAMWGGFLLKNTDDGYYIRMEV